VGKLVSIPMINTITVRVRGTPGKDRKERCNRIVFSSAAAGKFTKWRTRDYWGSTVNAGGNGVER